MAPPSGGRLIQWERCCGDVDHRRLSLKLSLSISWFIGLEYYEKKLVWSLSQHRWKHLTFRILALTFSREVLIVNEPTTKVSKMEKKEFFLEFGKDFAARGKSLDDKVTRKVLKKHFNIGLKILRIEFGTVSGPDRTGNNQRAGGMARVNDFAVDFCGDFDSN